MAREFKALFNDASARLRELDRVLADQRAASADLLDRIIPGLAEHEPTVARAVATELARKLGTRVRKSG